MQTIALIDYGAGNIPSAQRALEVAVTRSGNESRLIVTNRPEDVAGADRIVIPGVAGSNPVGRPFTFPILFVTV